MLLNYWNNGVIYTIRFASLISRIMVYYMTSGTDEDSVWVVADTWDKKLRIPFEEAYTSQVKDI